MKLILHGPRFLRRTLADTPPPAGAFDTILTFNPSLTDAGAGVGAVAGGSVSANEKFEFNATPNPAGRPTTMTLNVLGSDVMDVNFPDDYLGHAFLYVGKTNLSYGGTFAAGTVIL